jgi:D-amino-acid oxidase
MIGGIYGEHDWPVSFFSFAIFDFHSDPAYRYPMPRADTTTELLIRGLALCPELAPPEIRAMRTPTVSDLWPLVVEEGCGLRPARAGGIRLEREWVQNSTSERKVLVIHNYGCALRRSYSYLLTILTLPIRHAGCGFQGSWGSASRVLEFIEDSLLAVPTV